MHPMRVVIADSHPVVRSGLRSALNITPDIIVVGEEANGREALSLCRVLRPDILLVEPDIPSFSAVESITRLRSSNPSINVLILTTREDKDYVQSLIQAGISGYILKSEPLEVIIQAIRSIAHGHSWFSQTIVEKLVCRSIQRGDPDICATLTRREQEVLHLITIGKRNRDIGIEMNISEKAVEKHIKKIFTKLGVRSRVEAARRAFHEQHI